MTAALPFLRRQAARVVALAVIGACYAAAQLPTLDPQERRELADHFAFTPLELTAWPEGPRQTRRRVNPSLERHSGWISAVGAAIALADLDGDGLANDVCQVDPRTDRVTLAPAPGGPTRYPVVALAAAPLPYDRATMAPMGCIPRDVNEDGRTDLFVYYWGRTPVVFLRTGPPGPPRAEHFVPQEIVASGERWYTNAATFADLDGDGHLDLVVGNYFPDGARILDPSARQPDFMQHSMSRAYNGGHNRVFLFETALSGARPQVVWREVEGLFSRDANYAWTLAIGAADLDGDLLPELYYANDFGPDRLYHNRSRPGELHFVRVEGERGLATPRSKVLGRDSFKGMSVDFGDVNGDGRLDIFVSNIAAEYALLESHFLFVSRGEPGAFAEGTAPYEDASEPLGVSRSSWGWDTRFGDFDNDGVLEALQATGFAKGETDRWPELQELAMGNDELLRLPGSWPRFQAGDDLSGHAPNPFYVRAADGRYYDLAAELGLDAPQVSRGIATADVDGDGDLDFAVANQWEASYLYRNDRPAQDDFLGLHLLLPVGLPLAAPAEARVRDGHPARDTIGRAAVGASVRIRRSDGRELVAQVDGGNGHSGVRSPELHFGLGAAAGPARAEIRYRDRFGHPMVYSVTLEPGWHTVLLPDAPAPQLAAAARSGR